MSLRKSSDIPADAVRFTSEGDAAKYIWDIVYNWKTTSEIWALKYGPAMLGCVNSICGVVINKHYRTQFKLKTFGQLSSGLPVFIMPALLTTLFHNYLIPTDMLLVKSKPCLVCYEVKAAVIQWGFGLAYPMVLAPTATLMLANRYGTFRVPDLSDGAKVMFNFLRKHTRRLNGTLAYMAAIQLIASASITYFEMKNNYTLKQEILEIEKKIDAEQGYGETLKD